MKDNKLTSLDSKEIPRYTYDEENNANRVTIVGDFGIAEAIEKQLKDIKIELPKVPEYKATGNNTVQTIEVPVIVKEIEQIKVPVITQELEVIKLPFPIKETVIEKVEVPVIIKEKEIQVVYSDKLNYKLLFIFQALTLALIVISKFLGK